MKQLTDINFFNEDMKFLNKITISESDTISSKIDCRIIIDKDEGIPELDLTLLYEDNEDGVIIEIHTFRDCTVTYYINENDTEVFNMLEGTSIKFLYHNGWKHNGIYDAVWN